MRLGWRGNRARPLNYRLDLCVSRTAGAAFGGFCADCSRAAACGTDSDADASNPFCEACLLTPSPDCSMFCAEPSMAMASFVL